jgi:nucleoside-diphosphate-sugar epimerase
MSTYLVTGVAGFIAARVTEMLLDGGHTVVGVDNMNAAYDVRMKEYRLSRLQGRVGFTFHRLDISQRDELNHLLCPQSAGSRWAFDAVINLAARAGVRPSMEDPWVYIQTNVIGTLNLLEYCRWAKVPKFILASTSSIYGADAPLPTPEDADSSHPLQAYAASKKGAEVLCHSYHHLYGLDVTVFRYFTVYGPAGRPDMSMFRFTKWISEGETVLVNGDGEQTRGFTYVDDIARGTLLGLKPLGYEIINLGGHESIKINQLIQLVEETTGRNARLEYQPRHPADMLASWANVEKAGRLLGWEPQVRLKEGVGNLVQWYLAERSWASQLNL